MKEQQKNLFLKKCVENMKIKQEKLMKTYNFGKEENNYIMFPDKSRFYMFNKETGRVFFEAKIQIIGTYSGKSNTWRWAWSNRFVPAECKKTGLKIMDFGKANKIEMLSKPKIKGENMGHIFTALGMELSNARGYYIIPGTRAFPDIFLIFTKCKKVELKYEDIKKKNTNNKRRATKKMKNKMEKPFKELIKNNKKLNNNKFSNSKSKSKSNSSSSYLNKLTKKIFKKNKNKNKK